MRSYESYERIYQIFDDLKIEVYENNNKINEVSRARDIVEFRNMHKIIKKFKNFR